MSGRLLIDARYKDETRIAILDENGKLENFEVERSDRRPIKGNIYLAKIVRIEPSIQAAFIDYGAEKHGFLPLSEIHYEYFNKNNARATSADGEDHQSEIENDKDKRANALRGLPRHFKIQNVISAKQVVLVQAEKEVRGNKCAFFTTFISLPGRYCVLVPNSPKNKGPRVSKRLDDSEKIRLREIVESLDLPEGMGCIVRTAGENCNKQEIKRDLDYLFRLWNEINEKRANASIPSLIYEEGNVVKRSIRDSYRRTMNEIMIQGAGAFKEAKTFMKLFTPSHVKKIKLYENKSIPLFHSYDIEEKIKEILDPVVPLPSGGSIIIGVTEALTAIDVNSGKSKSERDINGTAVKTNLEAVTEIARQLKLRDIAGIIVIDFIDMIDQLSIGKVERRMREVMKQDRSNVQIGKISQFGLLELSRQRLRTSYTDSSFTKCKHCAGIGKVLSTEAVALSVIRQVESFLLDGKSKAIIVEVASGADLFILNQKRQMIMEMEETYGVSIEVVGNQLMEAAECKIIVKEFARDRQAGSEDQMENDEVHLVNRPRQKLVFNEAPEAVPDVAEPPAEGPSEPVNEPKHRRRRKKNYRSSAQSDGLLASSRTVDGAREGGVGSTEKPPAREKSGKDWWLKKLFP
ncbi:MAG: Rne/Rng family ribonuclease [Holosporales bacterium]|nr:Rne/Rng family ribonuclease [Holosporales bacterium]